MPTTTAPGFILDPSGNPYPLAPTPQGTQFRRTADDDRLRPQSPNHYGDYIDLLSPRNAKRLVSEGRAVGTRGQPASLLDQKADYVAASDFRPQFRGQDHDYGTLALPILESALNIANLRGYLYDWRTTWRLGVPTLGTDGSFYVLLTKWETGYPAIQILERHRIGQRDDGKQVVGADDASTVITTDSGAQKTVRGAYRGLRITGGQIYNRAGTEVAYRVLGADPKGSEDYDISARDLYRVARPRSYSEGTTPPEIAAALFDFIGLELAQSAQLDQQIEDARLTLIEENATGTYQAGAAFGLGQQNGNASKPGAPTTESIRGGTRYIKTGYSVKAHQSERPSDQWMNFDSRVHSRGATGIRWRAEMLDPAALKGASNRALQDQINTLIRETFTTLDRAASRACNYVAAVLAGPDLKALPLHPETMRWGIAPPPWFEVDRASAKYDLDDVAAGRVAMSTLHARDGKTSTEVYNERARAYMEALSIQKKYPEVPLDQIMGDLGKTVQRTGAQGAPSPSDPDAS